MRILAVGHPGTVATNQEPYAALLRRGVDVHVVVPDRWRHELEAATRPSEVHPDLDGRVHAARAHRVAWRVQRHVYLTPPGRWLRQLRPDVVLVDAEHFSVPAAQWVLASRWRRTPVAVSAWENLDRPLPWPARRLRSMTLRTTTGVFARTPSAAHWARHWGARGPVRVVPPAVHLTPPPATTDPARPFTIGFAGRLVEAKGIRDLLAALDRLPDDVRLLVAGDGPLRELVAGHPAAEVRVGVRHHEMAALYAEMDVLVLPSRTTPTWAEQFGRVLLEAMAAGRPVIGADSGEIPWVLSQARGGVTYPEGDVAGLAALILDVRDDPVRWRATAEQGQRDVAERFSPEASADALLELATELLAARTGQ